MRMRLPIVISNIVFATIYAGQKATKQYRIIQYTEFDIT